jgi:hypothetical protein
VRGAAIAVLCILSGAAPAAAQARVPATFFGTMWDGAIAQTAPQATQDREWERMATTGVRAGRATFEWVNIEPERGKYDFTTSDRLVRLAATHDVELLPVVLYAPRWARENRTNFVSPPKRPADYARLMGTLVRRYGPDGSFWAANPKLPRRPLRAWHVWNEPHLDFQWDGRAGDDWAKDYGRLLRYAYRAVHRADPGARVVLAGLTNRSYVNLNHLYRRGHIRGSFDVAALHPYTTEPSGVVHLIRRFRAVMAHNGDARKPLWITELGLPASRGRFRTKSDLQTTDRGMARFLSRSYKAIAAARAKPATRVERAYWYTWASVYCCEQFRFSGLLHYDEDGGVRAMPALRALRATVRALRPKPVARPVAAAAPRRKVPFGFVGTVADGPLFEPWVDLPGEVNAMVGTGVEAVRVVVDWRTAQPYASFAEVPEDKRQQYRDEGGVPTDYSLIDSIVGLSARHDMRVLPVVLIAPPWAARQPGAFNSPPSDPAPYARFVAALARRYGPNGSFWAEHPELEPLPARDWQVWNEPSLRDFWSDDPWVKDYVALMRATRTQLRAVDPRARLILAGLPNRSWTDLARIYRARGGRYFDAVALHPFTAQVDGVFTILEKGRKVMARYGDARKPLLVTELSWPSAKGKTKPSFGIETTERGQAQRLAKAIPELAARRRSLRLESVYWYTWLTEDRRDDYPFDYAGASRIRDGKVVRKPAFRALRQTALRLEGCAAKPSGARSCTRR